MKGAYTYSGRSLEQKLKDQEAKKPLKVHEDKAEKVVKKKKKSKQ